MKKAGEIFHQERKKRGKSIKEIIAETKIPQQFLTAIEADNYYRLPRGVYSHLYVRKYARYLDLSEERMVAIFRRDYKEVRKKKSQFPLGNFRFAPNWQKLIGGGVIVLTFTGYLFYQYLSFVSPPKVKIISVDLTQEGRVIKGKTDSRATLRIDGEIVNLDRKGNFSYLINDKEEREISIVVESPTGKTREIVKELRDSY